MKCIKFKKGNDVKWSSQANGNWKHKKGEIVAVIGAGVIPDCTKFSGLRVGRNSRSEVSYVVRTKDGKHYWPWSTGLRKV